MVNTALVASVALACSGLVVQETRMNVELGVHTLAIPAIDARCDVPQQLGDQALLARIEHAVATQQPLELASPWLIVGETVLSCEVQHDPCAAYDVEVLGAFEFLADNSTDTGKKKKNQESKADKEPLYCDGEQFELLDDDKDPDIRAFSYFKISILELFMAFVAVLLDGGQVLTKDPSALELAGRFATTAGHCYYVARVGVKYLTLLFNGKIDYFCHTLGIFSYRAIWMISNFGVNTVTLFVLAKNAKRKGVEYALAAAVIMSGIAAAIFACAWLIGAPVILFLLFVNITTFVVFIPWFIGFMVINLFPFHIAAVGGAVGIAAMSGKELNAKPKDMAVFSLVRSALLILMIPIFVWYNFGYFGVVDAYNKTPSFLLRLFKLNSKILADLNVSFDDLKKFANPNVVSLALLRFATDYVGVLMVVRVDWIATWFQNLCGRGTAKVPKPSFPISGSADAATVSGDVSTEPTPACLPRNEQAEVELA